MTKYVNLEAAQKAADIRGRALQMTEEWLDLQIRDCEYQISKHEAKLEAYRNARTTLDAKRDLAARVSV